MLPLDRFVLVLAGALLGYALLLTWLAVRLDRERQTALERLYGAWKDGAQIPPAVEPVVAPEPETAFEGLPSPIMDWLSQYEEPQAREKWARRARAILAKHKQDVVKTLVELDTPWG